MKQPPEQRFTLLYRGRACRVYRTFSSTNGVASQQVQIQFEDGHTAIVSRAEVMSPAGTELQGPDVAAAKPPLALVGLDGNAFTVLGQALRAARRAGWSQQQVAEYREKATSDDYDTLLAVTMDYFDVV
jgi:hypothetical protein